MSSSNIQDKYVCISSLSNLGMVSSLNEEEKIKIAKEKEKIKKAQLPNEEENVLLDTFKKAISESGNPVGDYGDESLLDALEWADRIITESPDASILMTLLPLAVDFRLQQG